MCDDAPPPPTFGMLDVRVGKIVEAWEHPDSDKLWVEKIDVGEVEVEGEGEEAKETPAPRQIASGLRAHYATAADLEGRAVIVVCNLKEAKLGGVPSNGMVLCASGDDGTVAFVHSAVLRVCPSRHHRGIHLERCHAKSGERGCGSRPAFVSSPRATSSGDAGHVTTTRLQRGSIGPIATNNDVSSRHVSILRTTSRTSSRAPPPPGFARRDSGRWTMR